MSSFRKTALLTLFCLAMPGLALAQPAPGGGGRGPAAPPMLLTSSGFSDGGVIPDKYSSVNPSPVSPALTWVNPPAATVSFTLIAHDPDGIPVNKSAFDTLHWLVFNLPATARALPEGVPVQPQLPDGSVQIKNRGGNPGYMGLGARGVDHHYTFELYALDTKLNLTPDATRPEVMAAMEGHVLAKAAYEGRFHRP